MKNVNYKRLLLMSLLANYSDEGQCWTGGWDRETYGIDKLNQEEKEALQEALDEVGKLVGEEISCDGFSNVDKICPKCNHKYSYHIPTGYRGKSQKCPSCKFQDPRK